MLGDLYYERDVLHKKMTELIGVLTDPRQHALLSEEMAKAMHRQVIATERLLSALDERIAILDRENAQFQHFLKL